MALGIEFAILLASIVLLLYLLSKHAHNYWKRKNVPFIQPQILFGNLKKLVLFEESPATTIQKFYMQEDGKKEPAPAIGMYLFYTPALIIRDLNLVKKILIKDFNLFSNRFSTVDPHADVLGYYNMFFVKNPEWKQIRGTISPVFTSGKIKQMFHLVAEIGTQLDSYLRELKPDPKTNKVCLEMKEICALYTTDVIATVAFGIQANSITNPNGEFRKNGREIFSFTPIRALHFLLIFFSPIFGKLFKSKIFSAENTNFLRSAIHSAITARGKTDIQRNDLIDILIAMRKGQVNTDIEFTDDMLVAQAAVFFNAGYETSSTTMSFALYELCKNMECQTRLRNEIKQVLKENKGELSYDTVMNMEYLNMVLMEVLRLYPPLPFLDRECTAPNGYSCSPEMDCTIPKGMPIYIPHFAIQRDPEYFPDPEKFDPERFSPANKDKLVPYSYMPFGLGPHNCIGERFGLIQSKIGLISVLRNHSVKPTDQTPVKVKLNKALIIQADGGVNLELVRDP